MSGAGENRWRRPGQGNRQDQNRSSGANTPTKEGGRQQAPSTTTSNAWGGKGKASGPAPAAQNNAATVHHVPVRDFNSNEVRDFLRKKYMENTAGTDATWPHNLNMQANKFLQDKPSVHHEVKGDSVAKRASGAWGSRGNMAHLMPNGQDFFALLRKQLIAVDQSKPTQ